MLAENFLNSKISNPKAPSWFKQPIDPTKQIMFQNEWNIMLAVDSYKASHHHMLPDTLTYMESYGEARLSSKQNNYPYTVVFGMQYYVLSYLVGKQITEEKIQEAEWFYNLHFGANNVFDGNKWRYILHKYDGILPIKIEAVKEGSILPRGTMMYKISSLDKNCVWLVNWVETLFMKTWYPITIATNSRAGREIIEHHFNISGEKLNMDFAYHDFGGRGVASEEQCWIGTAAHLLSFKGTDTVQGIRMLMRYYQADMCGFSVPASEHMVMTVRGKDNELQTYRDILRKYSTPEFSHLTLSLVSDTYDIYNVCRMLKDDEECYNLIMNRSGKLVIRPDSGDPKEVILNCLNILGEKFGYTVNKKGYRTLNPKIGLIQGDGIDNYEIHNILNYIETKVREEKDGTVSNGWSIDNIIFGSGGALLQKFNRDTLAFAIKASYAIVDNKEIEVYKDPITSKGSKTSKKGQLYTVFNPDTGYKTINKKELEQHKNSINMMQVIFEMGVAYNIQTKDDIDNILNNEVAFINALPQPVN